MEINGHILASVIALSPQEKLSEHPSNRRPVLNTLEKGKSAVPVSKPLTSREQYSVFVFRNWVLGKVCGTERGETAGDWRKELNEELQDLYSSPNSIRLIKENEMGGAYSTYGTEKKCMCLWWGNEGNI